MDRFTTWAFRLTFAAVAAGALLSRDACLGNSRPPPPDPPAQTATAAPTPPPAPTATYATPP